MFLKPFVLCHEIGHQLGYAKENEANFVGFLASHQSQNIEFRYSAYFEMYLYASRELMYYDASNALLLRMVVHEQFVKDYKAFLEYLFKSRNVVEPLMTRFYDNYLKLNNQPKGKATYNEVIAWLIAYMKKYGSQAI